MKRDKENREKKNDNQNMGFKISVMMLRKVSQPHKNKYCMFFLSGIWEAGGKDMRIKERLLGIWKGKRRKGREISKGDQDT
jgi:hypothetical protein